MVDEVSGAADQAAKAGVEVDVREFRHVSAQLLTSTSREFMGAYLPQAAWVVTSDFGLVWQSERAYNKFRCERRTIAWQDTAT